MDGGDLHHRAGPGVGGVVAGELAEWSLGQRLLTAREQPALENDFSMSRNRQAGLRAVAHFDRSALDRAGKFIFRTAVGQIFKASNEQSRIFAMNHGYGTVFAAVPIFFGDDRAVAAAVIELH